MLDYTKSEVYGFISKQSEDPIVEWKICKFSGEKFAIFQSDVKFLDKISPTFAEKKYQVPLPTLCPEERQRRRMVHKNDRSLHRNTCGLTGSSIITVYDPQKHKKVYNVKDRWSDKWNPLDYAQDFDKQKDFFSQFFDLHSKVPKIAMVNDNGRGSENCEYTQNVAYAKNCYLTSVAWKLENCHYSTNMAGGRWLLDNFFVMNSENCYECTDSYNLYNCFLLQNSSACRDCWFGADLIGCTDCLLCVGLQNQQYYILNKQYSKEDYERYKEKFQKNILENVDAVKQKFKQFMETFPQKAMHILNSDLVSCGNNLVNAENGVSCYNIKNLKDSKYCMFGDTIEKCCDLTVGGEAQRCYECITPDNSYRACFSIFCRSCTNVWYSEMCHHCQDCFGCVGLRNQQYCIFNKQYTKEEYEILVVKIIDKMVVDKSWGEFFPIQYTPFGYNETDAIDFFPLKKEDIINYGWQWYDRQTEIDIPDGIELLTKQKVKDLDINGYNAADLLNKAIVCEITGRPFRLISQELEFYMKYGLPLPTKHPNVRVTDRMEIMPTKKLHLINCATCGEKKLSVYPGNSGLKVYCDECYVKEIY